MQRLFVVSLMCGVIACGSGDPPESAASQTPATTHAEARAVLDKYAPMMRTKWDATLAIARDAAAAPPVTADEPLATPLPVRPIVPEAQLRSPGDMLLASPDRILDRDASAFGFYLQPMLFPYVELLAPNATTQIKPAVLEEDFARIAGIEYGLMVRVREVTPSKIITVVTDGRGELRYQAGSVRGDAILYELATKKRLGAMPFAYTAKGDYVHKTGATDEQDAPRLESHLRDSVQRQLVDAVQTFATRSADQ